MPEHSKSLILTKFFLALSIPPWLDRQGKYQRRSFWSVIINLLHSGKYVLRRMLRNVEIYGDCVRGKGQPVVDLVFEFWIGVDTELLLKEHTLEKQLRRVGIGPLSQTKAEIDGKIY